MKTVYKFKPSLHWNYITLDQYTYLWKFYANSGMLMIAQEE